MQMKSGVMMLAFVIGPGIAALLPRRPSEEGLGDAGEVSQRGATGAQEGGDEGVLGASEEGDAMSKRTLHCWADKSTWAFEKFGPSSDEWADTVLNNGTCLLPAGHEGEHEWTPDGEIMVTFKTKGDTK
jgi:hypothetical protein